MKASSALSATLGLACRLFMLTRCRKIPAESNHFPQSVLSWKINQSQDNERNAFKRLTRVQNSVRRLRSGIESESHGTPSCSRGTLYFDETRNETPRRMFKFNKCSKMSRKGRERWSLQRNWILLWDFAGLSVGWDHSPHDSCILCSSDRCRHLQIENPHFPTDPKIADDADNYKNIKLSANAFICLQPLSLMTSNVF